ncbi:iron uptake porin [Synechococcus sp. MU1655]|uniref:iron uptake porin n=1 Tax=Synechococcus sp. MU1655 TaxID=2508355 RepID=UPI002026E603|nr:iron uptake porin [Synechococcus sp. MU1655]
MKLFHQLLVAPAALGLLAPVAANATELNINGVSDYAATSALSSREQVTSITQFSDVYPTDWAYQALSNLIERYGCVAGYPNGTYRGNRAMTRFEAAALLNACLDRVTEVTDELKRLMKEFEKELAILKGRVDGLEARVGELEATQFSTTTKLKGQATFVIGANSYGGSSASGELPGNQNADLAAAQSGATTFNYDMRLFLDTSFTGKDLLRTMLRAGNFNTSAFGGNSSFSGLSTLETAFEEGAPNNVVVNRLWYQFPIGSNFTATIGGRVRQDDMLAVWPSAYPSDTVLDFFTYAGAPQTYNLQLGAGAGLSWESNDFSISANYVSGNGGNSTPGVANTNALLRNSDDCGGIATDCAASSGTVQIAYAPENWGLAAAYNYASGNNGAGIYAGNGTPSAVFFSGLGTTNSFGLSAWWTPENAGWFPSISTGWGYNSIEITNANFPIPGSSGIGSFNGAISQSWYVGLQWADAFMKGNTLGMAVGQPTFVTSWDNNSNINGGSDFVADGNYAWEWWYMFQVTDNISVTPAIFYLSRPLGFETTALNELDPDGTFNNFGGLVKTTFRF